MIDNETYVIMPVYNEAPVVGDVIREVKKHFKHIVCINDGSSDKSRTMILKSGGELIEHLINLGSGAATQTGIDYSLQDSNAKYFITIDADGQHEIKDSIRMLDYLKKSDLDIVFGSRFTGDVKNLSSFKRFFLKGVAIFSHKISGVNLTDPHVGLRAFNRNFAEHLNLTLPGFAHASEMIYRIPQYNYKYAEIPITVTYSDYSKSKGQPMLNAINMVVDLFFYRISQK